MGIMELTLTLRKGIQAKCFREHSAERDNLSYEGGNYREKGKNSIVRAFITGTHN